MCDFADDLCVTSSKRLTENINDQYCFVKSDFQKLLYFTLITSLIKTQFVINC